MSASLNDVAGWYCSRPRGGDGSESYAISAIAYCTDKNLWHKRGNHNHGVFAPPMPSDMLKKESFKRLDERMRQVVSAIALGGGQQNPSITQTGSARLEVRVPVEWASSVLTSVPDEFGLRCLVCFSPSVWQ